MDKDITQLNNYTSPDASIDVIPIVDVANNETKKITRNNLLEITGAPLGTTDTQSVQNKTLDNTNTIAVKDNLFTIQDGVDPTKQAQFQASSITAGQTRIYTLPDTSDTIVSIAAAQTLTNKTLTSPIITNPTLTVNTISEFSAANGVTIDGLNVKDGKLNTNDSVVTTNITDQNITNAKLAIGAGEPGGAWTSWIPTLTNFTLGNGTIVARYKQVGKTVYYRLLFTLGSTSAVGTTGTFSAPVTPETTGINFPDNLCGTANFKDASGSTYPGYVRMETSGELRPLVFNAAATYAVVTGANATVPFTWTTSDMLYIEGAYEAA